MSKKILEKKTTYATTGESETQWYPHFCLWPRKVEGKFVWLKTVERKDNMLYWFGTPISGTIEYRHQNKLRTLVEPMFGKTKR